MAFNKQPSNKTSFLALDYIKAGSEFRACLIFADSGARIYT